VNKIIFGGSFLADLPFLLSLSLESHPQAPRSFAESVLTALQDVTDGFSNHDILEAPGDITDHW
jgi:hypothetical protein